MLFRNLETLLNNHWWAQKPKWTLEFFRKHDTKPKQNKQTKTTCQNLWVTGQMNIIYIYSY